jgi:hypothetical protein
LDRLTEKQLLRANTNMEVNGNKRKTRQPLSKRVRKKAIQNKKKSVTVMYTHLSINKNSQKYVSTGEHVVVEL